MMAIFKANYKINLWEQRPDLHVFQYNMPNHELPPDLTPPREDIQMTLNVIGRRGGDKIAIEKTQKFHIDLRRCNFDRADLQGAKLKGANLSEAQLQGANLKEAQLQGAGLVGAQLQGAGLVGAQLQVANLTAAQLQGANLTAVQLQGAGLVGAKLQGANLREVQLQGTILSNVQFDRSTSFTQTKFHISHTKDVDFANTTISYYQLQTMFGDGSNRIDKKPWPSHWPREELEWRSFFENYDAWKYDYIKAHTELNLDQE